VIVAASSVHILIERPHRHTVRIRNRAALNRLVAAI